MYYVHHFLFKHSFHNWNFVRDGIFDYHIHNVKNLIFYSKNNQNKSMSVKQSDKMVETLRSFKSEAGKLKQDSVTFSPQKGVSVYLKILLNYLQMISIIESLQLKWPIYVQNYLNVYANIGGVSTEVLSLDCFLQDITFILI